MGKIFEMAKIISGYSREEAERRFEVCRNRYTDDNVTEYKKFDMFSEAMLLSQRLMDLAKEDVISKIVADEPDMNTDAWVIPPKHDNQDFWLNEFGQRNWTLGNPMVKTAQRSYYWCNRVIILDATRTVLEDIKFSDFVNRIDAEGWEPEIPKVKVDFNKDKK